jgi:hypothetical protein
LLVIKLFENSPETKKYYQNIFKYILVDEYQDTNVAQYRLLSNLITDSGELHFWQTTARAGDLFGSTLYRVVWNKEFGYIHYDWLSPAWYRFKLWLANRSPETAYVIELQAEPWLPDTPIKDVTLEEQNKSMNLVQLQANIDFAKRLGFARIYLWGAEWWYYEQLRGNEEIAAYIEQLEK